MTAVFPREERARILERGRQEEDWLAALQKTLSFVAAEVKRLHFYRKPNQVRVSSRRLLLLLYEFQRWIRFLPVISLGSFVRKTGLDQKLHLIALPLWS